MEKGGFGDLVTNQEETSSIPKPGSLYMYCGCGNDCTPTQDSSESWEQKSIWIGEQFKTNHPEIDLYPTYDIRRDLDGSAQAMFLGQEESAFPLAGEVVDRVQGAEFVVAINVCEQDDRIKTKARLLQKDPDSADGLRTLGPTSEREGTDPETVISQTAQDTGDFPQIIQNNRGAPSFRERHGHRRQASCLGRRSSDRHRDCRRRRPREISCHRNRG